MRIPLEAVNQNRWLYPREGAWLKPTCWGDRVDLQQVDRCSLEIWRKSDRPVRWFMTSLKASSEEPARLSEPLLPNGPLVDSLGQNTLQTWSSKSNSTEEVSTRLHTQLADAPAQSWPADFSAWGGWLDRQLPASGFFRIEKDAQRWWLVDPLGHPFWSAGVDCVAPDTAANILGLETALAWKPDPEGPYQAVYEGKRPATINFLKANLVRAFGPEDWYARWATITLAELRRIGFNTLGNWSDWKIARQAGLPYVRSLDADFSAVGLVYRDFPDVFAPAFQTACDQFALQLQATAQDPALIGYFLMNEPTWGFAQLTPAEGMLLNAPACHSLAALSAWLRERYLDDAQLSAAWGINTTFAAVAHGSWTAVLTEQARTDLAEFSSVMVERFFGGLSAACRGVDPNHLNLGIRYYTVPPEWALESMRRFDVFSMNCYRQRLPEDEMGRISALLDMPIMIGEWHFGALDAGLPASGIGHVPNQAGRGSAYRYYLENAAAQPWCVGVHYFILYDQSALGRFDGENYNIGFLDVCNRPYEALCQAARTSHERLYSLVSGQTAPFADPPEYLPMLFL